MSELYVIFKLAGAEYALPAVDVVQMESYSKITPVPGAPPFVAGLIQIRQDVIPVINTRLRFGLPDQEPTADSRFIILKQGRRLVAILVDSAREVRGFNPEDFSQPPEVLAQQATRFVRSVAQIKDRIIMSIDGSKMMGEEMQNG